MRWTWLRFEALGVEHLYDVLALRGRVFVVEQGAFLDPDGADRTAWHLLGRDDGGAGEGDSGPVTGVARAAATGTGGGHGPDRDRDTVTGPLCAYLRVVDAGVRHAEPSIGRVAVVAGRRGRGLGHALVAEGVARCAAAWPGRAIRLSAQSHLAGFYARHGFVRSGEPYAEDGIPHLPMRRPASAVARPATSAAAVAVAAAPAVAAASGGPCGGRS